MMLNLTQHPATAEQAAAGVVDLPAEVKSRLVGLLTFDNLPSREDVDARARAIAELAQGTGARSAMIGGAPYIMSALERELRGVGITAFYAFSKRESVEEVLPDGTVRKTSVFRHAGFVPAL